MPAQARHPIYRCALVAMALFALLATSARGSVVFDWPSAPGWTAGQPNSGQTKTQQFTSVTTNDITVSIYNSGVGNHGGYPAINSTETTGGFTGLNALQLYLDNSAAVGNYLRVTVSFATPVTNLSFQLWDCDALAGQFVDTFKNIQAVAVGGATVGADTLTSAVAGYNTITGTGLSTVITGIASASNTTNQGTIDIAFNQPITQFSFEWSNTDAGRGAQAVGLGPLTYTVLPEGRPGLFSIGSCLFAVLCESVRRRRAKRNLP